MSAGHVDERQPLIGRVDESGAHRAPQLGDDGEDAGRAKMGGGAWGVCTRVTVCAVAAMGLIGAAYRGLNHHHPATAVLLGLGDVPTVDAGLLGHADEAMHRADERRETARLARVDARRAERRAGKKESANHDESSNAHHVEPKCRLLFYYHVPKTGGGSIVRYFHESNDVDVIRYESTKYITPAMGEIYTWNSASHDDHWDRYVVPQAMKPGNHLVVEHWGRPGMVEMGRRVADLRQKAENAGCEVMTSTTLRDPIDRDVSDDVFRRMHGGKDAGIDYLGDEQTRFLLLNSERARDGVAPRDLYGDHRARVEAEGALRAATRILRDDFDLVATIDDLEAQKDAFVDFFKLERRTKDVKKSAETSAEKSEPLGREHAIDYAKEGIDATRMKELRAKFERSNDLDKQLYRIAAEMSASDERLDRHRA